MRRLRAGIVVTGGAALLLCVLTVRVLWRLPAREAAARRPAPVRPPPPPRSELGRRLAEALPTDPAGAVLPQDVEKGIRLLNDAGPEVLTEIRRLIADPREYSEFRLALLDLLGRRAGPGDLRVLMDLAGDRALGPRFRESAMFRLEKHDVPGLAPLASKILSEERSFGGRIILVRILLTRSSEGALAALRSESDPAVRTFAIEGLAEQHDRAGVTEALLEVAASAGDDGVRSAAVMALSRSSHAEVDTFLERLKADPAAPAVLRTAAVNCALVRSRRGR